MQTDDKASHIKFCILRPEFFLLVDLREIFFRSRVGGGGGRKKINKKL